MNQTVTEVVWIDSMITDMTPIAEGNALDYATITSVGYVVEETDTMLALARERTMPMKHWRGVVCIPKVAITSRRVLAGASPTPAAPWPFSASCAYCPAFFPANDPRNPQTRLRQHMADLHPAAFSQMKP